MTRIGERDFAAPQYDSSGCGAHFEHCRSGDDHRRKETMLFEQRQSIGIEFSLEDDFIAQFGRVDPLSEQRNAPLSVRTSVQLQWVRT